MGKRTKYEIRDIGQFQCINSLEGKYASDIESLLERLVEGTASKIANYYKITKDIMFLYGERTLSSAIAPTLDELGEAFLMECPTKRKSVEKMDQDPKTKPGREGLDYWVLFHNIDILFEAKCEFLNWKTQLITEYIIESWENAHMQLESIKDESLEIIVTEGSKENLKVALMLVPIWETTNEDSDSILYQSNEELKKLFDIQESLVLNLKPEPNWSMCWRFNNEMVGPHEIGGKKESYAGLVFVAHVIDNC
jgi:hypothetical protein